MKYMFINTDKEVIKKVINEIGQADFYAAFENSVLTYRKELKHYRLKSEENSIDVVLQIGYPSQWHDLLKIQLRNAPREFWELTEYQGR